MTRQEITDLAEPLSFRPFVIVTSSGDRFDIRHADYIDVPPLPENGEATPSYVTVYNRAAVPRFIILAHINSVEFKPLSETAE